MNAVNELYQEVLLDHYRRPRNRRRLEDPNCQAEGANPLCGDHVTIYLKVRDDLVQEVTFQGSGCAISTASASIMTETLKGKTLAQAQAIFEKFHGLVTGEPGEPSEQRALGKLAIFSGVCRYPARVKCATLAWHTLASALRNRDETVTTE